MKTLGKLLSEDIYNLSTTLRIYDRNTYSSFYELIVGDITRYLIENTSIQISYSGVIPGTPPIPESAIDFAKITGSISIPAISSDFDQWIQRIEVSIRQGFLISAGSRVIPKSTIFPLNVIPILSTFLNIDKLKQIHFSNLKDPLSFIWNTIAEGIITWLTSGLPQINTYPAGILGTGLATINKIIIS